MKEPIFVRALTEKESPRLPNGLRSGAAFTLRRCQMLLGSADGKTPRQIARPVGRPDQPVRNVIRAFEREGGACFKPKSSVPKARHPEWDTAKCATVRAWLHASPRQFGKGRSRWTLNLGAEVCFEQGLTKALVSEETLREALRRLGVKWTRARDWITSPDPQYARKKRRETA